jgi:hypothetical protein
MAEESLGARKVEEVTADVTSLTNADNEPLSTWTDQSGIDVVDNATVVSHDDKAYLAKVDLANDQVLVVTVSDGSDPTATTDVGSITLRLEGRR